MKTVAMAGATGMIGSYLSGHLKGYKIMPISRKDFLLEEEEFAHKYRKADIIINLSGAPIIRRWTKKNRQKILNSRIMTTRKLGCIMEHDNKRERMYLSASGIGIYNDIDVHTEDSTAWGKGFMAELVKQWEKEVHRLESTKTTICIMRLGVVLSKKGGMLERLLPFFKWGLGARIGSGKQYFSWVHIKDLGRAISHILENKQQGIYNFTAPGYCNNRHFTKMLGTAVRKPAILAIPKIVFRLIYGRAAMLITGGQAVMPNRLIKEGFIFDYQDIDKALRDLVD